MKIDELMIGDWVLVAGAVAQVADLIATKKPAELTYIHPDGRRGTTTMKDVEPIPATNGLYDRYGNELPDYVRRFQIDYVHELQHALRLCGINGIIKDIRI